CSPHHQMATSGKISSCTSLKSLADAKASPTFFPLYKIKFASLSLIHDTMYKSNEGYCCPTRLPLLLQ
ncbi:MAG: hypothetical protein MRY78_12205, partial [Saprospiraceae bacterium]|nr:hypothetical protein [Saprospiraceae bacterium]